MTMEDFKEENAYAERVANAYINLYHRMLTVHQGKVNPDVLLSAIATGIDKAFSPLHYAKQNEEKAKLEKGPKPKCRTHDVEMRIVNGPKGPFWGCPLYDDEHIKCRETMDMEEHKKLVAALIDDDATVKEQLATFQTADQLRLPTTDAKGGERVMGAPGTEQEENHETSVPSDPKETATASAGSPPSETPGAPRFKDANREDVALEWVNGEFMCPKCGKPLRNYIVSKQKGKIKNPKYPDLKCKECGLAYWAVK